MKPLQRHRLFKKASDQRLLSEIDNAIYCRKEERLTHILRIFSERMSSEAFEIFKNSIVAIYNGDTQ